MVKNSFNILIISFLSFEILAQNAKIIDSYSGTVISNAGGTDIPYSSSILDIRSTNKAVLLPRMSTINRDAIASPVAGMVVYNNTTNQFNFYDGIAWQQATFGNQWGVNGTNYYYSGGKVGIGTNSPDYLLTVAGQARISDKLAINDPVPDYNLDVNGNAGIDNLGVGVGPDPAYPLKAGGTTNLSALLVTSTANFNSTVNITGTLNANGALAVNGNITTNSGFGIVRSADAGQLAIDDYTTPANLVWNLNPGQSTCCVGMAFSTFTAKPSIAFGETTGATNPGHIQYTIESITTNSAQIRVTNIGTVNSTATGSGQFRAMIIGKK